MQYAVENAWEEFGDDLATQPPKLIVDVSAHTSFAVDRFPLFAEYLHAHYDMVEYVDGAYLYVRHPGDG